MLSARGFYLIVEIFKLCGENSITPARENIKRLQKNCRDFRSGAVVPLDFALNFILAGFSDAAVTVLGLYYKIQSFFFIPLFGLQTCIVPVLSYNYARANYARVRSVMRDSLIVSASFMLVGVLCFELIPRGLLSLFSQDEAVFAIGGTAFRIIGASFFPAVLSLMLPVFFQAIGKALPSVMLSLTRQIFCLIPLFWGFSLIGLDYAWIAFPAAELITGAVGTILYFRQTAQWRKNNGQPPAVRALGEGAV